VRDEAPFLDEALASVAAQTLSELEVLVVDDGSTDDSAAIGEAWAARDPRFRALRQEPLGLVAALERARAAACAPVLARMDGDDVCAPERLALQLAALEAEGLDAVGCGIRYVPDEAVRDGARAYAAWINGLVTVEAAARDVFVECPLPHPALVVRADALAAAGGYRDEGWPEDYDLVLRLWERGARFRNLDRVLLDWREHPERASRVDERYSQDAFVRCKVHFLLRTVLADGRDYEIWGAGPVGKSFARALIAAGRPPARFVDVDPRKIGTRVHGMPVAGLTDADPAATVLGAVAGAEARERIRALAPHAVAVA
jgi:glycosyltransferase involved in cell wall biosynthesis